MNLYCNDPIAKLHPLGLARGNGSRSQGDQMANGVMNVGGILDRLSEVSARPRYAFAVLNLLAEQAAPGVKVGPFIHEDGETLTVRCWIGKRLARLSGRSIRRKAIERRIRQELADRLPEDLFEAQQMVDLAVEEHVRMTGADNFTRVISELERAGYVSRFYQGYRPAHQNSGG